ncbi:MAG: hypothetical protein ACK58J_06860, partial [Planctomyces sp.]
MQSRSSARFSAAHEKSRAVQVQQVGLAAASRYSTNAQVRPAKSPSRVMLSSGRYSGGAPADAPLSPSGIAHSPATFDKRRSVAAISMNSGYSQTPAKSTLPGLRV